MFMADIAFALRNWILQWAEKAALAHELQPTSLVSHPNKSPWRIGAVVHWVIFDMNVAKGAIVIRSRTVNDI